MMEIKEEKSIRINNIGELFDTSNVPQSHTVSENDNLKKFQNKGMYDITGYEDYLIIHMPDYDWKISYESAEILKNNLDDVLDWRKE